VLLSPFLVVAIVFGVVVIVALVQAEPKDVPIVLKESGAVFRRLIDRLPHPRFVRDAVLASDVPQSATELVPQDPTALSSVKVVP
jgi:hypothetical protein